MILNEIGPFVKWFLKFWLRWWIQYDFRFWWFDFRLTHVFVRSILKIKSFTWYIVCGIQNLSLNRIHIACFRRYNIASLYDSYSITDGISNQTKRMKKNMIKNKINEMTPKRSIFPILSLPVSDGYSYKAGQDKSQSWHEHDNWSS